MSVPVNYGTLTEVQMQQDELLYMENVIKNELPKDGLMVEWGSGGSTIHWLKTMTSSQSLISIEHNVEWYKKVDHNLNENFNDLNVNFNYYLMRELYGFEHGYASLIEEHPTGLDNYMLPDKNILDADVFFIDGIGRAAVSLMVLGLSKKENPAIFIHDYVGREPWYDWATKLYPKKEVVGTTLLRLWK